MEAMLCPICGEANIKDNGDFFSCSTCGAKLKKEKMEAIQDQLNSLLQKNKEIDLGNLRNLITQELKKPKWDIDRIKSYSQEILTFYPEDIISHFLLSFIDKKGKLRDNYHYYLNKLCSEDIQEYELNVIVPIAIRYCENRDKEYVENLLKAHNIYDQYKNDLKEALEIRKKEIDLFNPEIEREVFVCHSSEDIEEVKQIDEALKKESYDVWYSEKNSPQDNVNYWNDINAAIEHCKIFLIVLSSSMLESRDCLNELKHAYDNHKVILEYRIDSSTNSRGIKQYFEGQWIDGSAHSNIDNLVEVIFEEINKMNKETKKEAKPKEEKKETVREEVPLSSEDKGIDLSSVRIDLSKKNDKNDDLYKDIFKLDQQSKAHASTFEEAKYQYSLGHYAKALQILAPVSSNYSYFLQARCLEGLGEYKHAREKIGRIISNYPLYYYYCGQLYEKGIYARGSRESIAYYEKSAKGGFVIAKRELGYIYLEKKDYVKAKTYFEDAASFDDINSKFELVKLYGEQEEIKPDYDKAYNLLMECVGASYIPAVEYLINALQHGNKYIQKDTKKAKELAVLAGKKYKTKTSYDNHFYNMKVFIPNVLAAITLLVFHILLNNGVFGYESYKLISWSICILGMVLILDSPLSRLSGYLMTTSQIIISGIILYTGVSTRNTGLIPYTILIIFSTIALMIMITKDFVKTKRYSSRKESVTMALVVSLQALVFTSYLLFDCFRSLIPGFVVAFISFLITLFASNSVRTSTKEDRIIILVATFINVFIMILVEINPYNHIDNQVFFPIGGIALSVFANTMFLLSTNRPKETMHLK